MPKGVPSWQDRARRAPVISFQTSAMAWRLSSRRPSSPQQGLERFKTRGSILAIAYLSIQLGLRGRPPRSARCWKCRHFCAQSNAASACVLAAEQSAAWIDRGTAIQRSSSPARSFNTFLRKTQTHAQKLQREQKNAATSLVSSLIHRRNGGLRGEARWRVAQSLTRI